MLNIENLFMFNDDAGADFGATGDFATSDDASVTDDNITVDDDTVQDNTGDVSGGTDDADAGVVDQQISKQDPKTDAAFAKMRREAEQYKRELEARDRWIAEQFGKSHGIYTWAQYQAALQHTLQQQEQVQQQQMVQYHRQKEQELRDMGLDPDQIREFFRTDPTFLQMQQENLALKNQLQQQQQLQSSQAMVNGIMKDYKQLKAKYGDLLPQVDESIPEQAVSQLLEQIDEQTYQYMKQGMTLKAAFLLANEDKILETAQTRAKQKTLRNVNSKSHLGTEKSNAAGDIGKQVELTPEQLRVWRMMGYSEKEARKRAAKYVKGGK